MTSRKESKLSGVPIFSDIPSEGLAEIERVVKGRVIEAGTMLFRQGDSGDSFFIIDSGRVRVFRRDAQGIETELSQLGPGDSFGEMALLTGEARSANVQAMEETHFTELTKDHLDEVLKANPHLSMAFVKQMSRWLRRGDSRFEMEAHRQLSAPSLSWIDFLLIVGLTVLFALVYNYSNPKGIPLFQESFAQEGISEIPAEEAFEKFKGRGVIFVDSMPSSFYEKEHVAGAVSLPLAIFDFMYDMALSQVKKDQEIIVYGRTISKHYDGEVASKLFLRGHKNLHILKGGFRGWKKKGFPVEP